MLDSLDRKILRFLQSDSSTTLSEIAEALDVGVATIHRRIQKMKIEGVIKRYIVVVDPEKLGKAVTCFVEVKTVPELEADILNRMIDLDEIMEVHKVTGDFDILVKIRVENVKELNKTLNSIRRIKGVISTRTAVVVEVMKEDYNVKL